MLVRVQFNARACAYVCVLFTLSIQKAPPLGFSMAGGFISAI